MSLDKQLPLKKIWDKLGEKRFYRTRIPGFTSDDTQQAMALLLVALNHRKWGDEATREFGSLLVSGFEMDAWRGYGKMFSGAADKLRRGVDYRSSGSASSGIGAAMRVAPLAGLLDWSDSDLALAAITSSLVTHADLRAAAMSFAVFRAARMFVLGYSAADIREQLPREVRAIELYLIGQLTSSMNTVAGIAGQLNQPGWPFDQAWPFDQTDPHSVSEALGAVLQWAGGLQISNLEISDFVLKMGEPYVASRFRRHIHPNNPFVLLGGVHALALALQDNADPLEILRYIVNLGDDTDTVAAIAGGILGARFGTDWIPETEFADRWRIRNYANKLVSGTPVEDPYVFLEREARLTQAEKSFQSSKLADWKTNNNSCRVIVALPGVYISIAK
ncbi:MAG: ADP-ribosylglycohydrolase family protein [Bdellovibrionales bacterium]|nr:ADP-ribosylglycohydrolase family protein [Bdellovibrionales bacterium]